MVGGKNKVNMFKELRERTAKRVTEWKAGIEVLIKSVAQAILTYSMSLFKLSKNLCNDINSIIAKYWWGQTSDEKKVHWINWKRLCDLKKKGGMGFRDINAVHVRM